MTHFWNWKKRLPERKGQQCRVLARGRLNTILVEFKDGHRVTTSRFAVRKIIPLLVLILASLACSTTVEPYVTYPADTPEPDAGAVYWPASPKTSTTDQCVQVIAAQALHLRAQPSERSQVLAYLYHEQTLQLLLKQEHWWRVQTGDKIGWAKAEFLKESECK